MDPLLVTGILGIVSGGTGAAIATGFFGLRKARIDAGLAERSASRQEAATDRGDLWRRISELEQAGRNDASAHRAELRKIEEEHDAEVKELRAEIRQLTSDLRTKDAEILKLTTDLRVAVAEIEFMRVQMATGAGRQADGTYIIPDTTTFPRQPAAPTQTEATPNPPVKDGTVE